MRKIIVLISIFILVTLGIELISMRIYEETYYDKITKVLIPDDSLIWKTKPNINTIFESAHLTTNSLGFRNDEIGEKTKKRIIIMGPSSSFGWGVEREKTFPFLLSQKLKNYEIINASVIGYSSYQGKILFETIIKKLSPDIIIFAYGVNDPDKYRFFKNYDLSDEKIIKRQSQINFLFDKISRPITR
jgi:lysophospholipase L1-like esterase